MRQAGKRICTSSQPRSGQQTVQPASTHQRQRVPKCGGVLQVTIPALAAPHLPVGWPAGATATEAAFLILPLAAAAAAFIAAAAGRCCAAPPTWPAGPLRPGLHQQRGRCGREGNGMAVGLQRCMRRRQASGHASQSAEQGKTTLAPTASPGPPLQGRTAGTAAVCSAPTCGPLALHHAKHRRPPPLVLGRLRLLGLLGCRHRRRRRCLRLRHGLLREHLRLKLPAADMLRQHRLLSGRCGGPQCMVGCVVKDRGVMAAHCRDSRGEREQAGARAGRAAQQRYQ